MEKGGHGGGWLGMGAGIGKIVKFGNIIFPSGI